MSQPKAPCKHVQGLIDYAIDHEIGIYADNELGNIYCSKCKGDYYLDMSAFLKVDKMTSQYVWYKC